MSNGNEIKNPQAVKPANETREVQQPQIPKRAPSAPARTLEVADSHARVRNYQQYVKSDDLRRVEDADGRSVEMFNSHLDGKSHDGEKDRKYVEHTTTHAQYRLFESGGLTQQRRETLSQDSVKQEDPTEGDRAFKNGLRRSGIRA